MARRSISAMALPHIREGLAGKGLQESAARFSRRLGLRSIRGRGPCHRLEAEPGEGLLALRRQDEEREGRGAGRGILEQGEPIFRSDAQFLWNLDGLQPRQLARSQPSAAAISDGEVDL